MNRYETLHRKLHWLFLALGIALLSLGFVLVFFQPSLLAAQESTEPAPLPDVSPGETESEQNAAAHDSVVMSDDDRLCLECHADTDQTVRLADGSALELGVHPNEIANSVHGTANPEGALRCVDCHGEDIFPHTQPLPPDRRVYTVDRSSTICTACHEQQTNELVDSVHLDALQAGNLTAATCVDCHGAHDVQPPAAQPVQMTQNCGSCHVVVYDEFDDSVHGQALLAGDPNVPSCSDCHGVHGVQNPTTALFRNRSPEMCAGCHGDPDLMAQYDISTHIFDTYLTDFHGTTVALFAQQDPNVPTNKAVCIDCHGVHDITPVDAERVEVVQQNLLEMCQQCHPGATSSFPASWVGHFPPTLESHPLLFLVNLFYAVLIPFTVGAFLLLIGTDIIRRIRRRGEVSHDSGSH